MAIDNITNPLTEPPAVPVIADGEATFNTRATAWLSYWKNNIYTEIGSFVDNINTLVGQVNTESGSINQIKVDVTGLKNDTNQIKLDTQTIKNDTNQIKSDTADLKNEVVAYIDNTYGTATLWTMVNMTTATHTASNIESIRVDATAIGSDVVIILPASPNNGDIIEFINADTIRTNTLKITRGDTTHKINGALEDADFNCNCSVKLKFDLTTLNWIKG